MTIGYFYQLLQIHISNKSLVFLTRDHTPTHIFVNHLRRFQKEACCPHNIPPAPFEFKNEEYRKNISAFLFEGQKIEMVYAYSLVYQRQKSTSSSWNPLKQLVKSNSPMAPKTLVLCGDFLILCDEDYANWPYVPSKNSVLPQFKGKICYNVSDVVRIVTVSFFVEKELCFLYPLSSLNCSQKPPTHFKTIPNRICLNLFQKGLSALCLKLNKTQRNMIPGNCIAVSSKRSLS